MCGNIIRINIILWRKKWRENIEVMKKYYYRNLLS